MILFAQLMCDGNEGDYDNNNRCKNDLVCGNNNCSNSTEFDPGDDCCSLF